jgi:HAE1 family hydrophobic/amphiphilic exporter-1
MNLSEGFIKRPVATTLLQLSIVIFGFIGYTTLPVSDLPTVDFPTIQVTAGLPGANPETMAAAVATPLEKQFSSLPGIDSISSSSSLGSTSITLQFALDRNIDAAAGDVEIAIARVLRQLPPDMPAPPSFQKVNPAEGSVLILTLTSATLPLADINEYAETTVAQRISMVKGVAQVNLFGTQKRAVRIDVNPLALAARDLSFDDLATAIQHANVNLPVGTLYSGDRSLSVKANGQLTTAAEFAPVIVSYKNGNPVRLSEVAHVYEGVENDKTASWLNDTRTVYIAINRQPGSNTVATVDGVLALLPQIQAGLPASLVLGIRSDRSQAVRDSVHDIKITLWLTVVLVILVIFLFLRNLSATIIPSLALPASIIGTFAVMSLLNYSLDNLSLMALTLAVGFVVDDAIVMLENIVRHMEHGEDAMTAALNGSKEVAFTILSMTLSLAAVFIPVLFMSGVVGRLLHEFAVVIGVAILVSGFVSISLTPMLSARFLKPPKDARHGVVYMAIEKVFDAALSFYSRTLDAAMRFHGVTMLISIALIFATVWCFKHSPLGFIPSQDTAQLTAQTEGAQGLGFDAMVAHQQAVADIIKADPGVRSFTSTVGFGQVNTGRFSIDLKPRDQRKLSADQILEELRPKLATVPGIRTYLQNPPVINIGGRAARAQYQFTLQGTDVAELYRVSPLLEDRLRTIPLIADVSSDLQLTNPQVNVVLDRDRISALGLTADNVESSLANAFSGRQISTIFMPNNQYAVLMRVAPEFQQDAGALNSIYVKSPSGGLVALSTVTRVTTDVGPLQVNHTGQLPSVTISFNLRGGVALGDAVNAVDAAARETLPDTVTTSFQGAAQAFQDSAKGLGVILIMAVFVIYVVLGILYESFIHPITILSGLPSAGLGALLTLMVFKVDLNLYAFVGVIMLVGLVKKNGIMMIDFAIEQRRAGKSSRDAMHEACLVRFRPIMMTTMAALVGTLPIALGLGAGAEARQPLGLAVVGGLVVSQTLTLYITPVFYLYMEAVSQWIRGRRVAIGA